MSGGLANQYRSNLPQSEGGAPTTVRLIPRSPYLNQADVERDMNRGSPKRGHPANPPKETEHRTKTTVNPRGPHYSGTHSQRSSSSSYSSLSDSGDSRYTGTISPTHLQDNPHHSSVQGQYTYQYRSQADPLQYSDSRRLGGPGNTRPQQHFPGRRAYENHPASYYTPHEYGPGAMQGVPQTAQYRHMSYMATTHSPLVKSYSEEQFRDSYYGETQRGFSSLGELPDPYNEPQRGLPQTAQYRYQHPSSGESTQTRISPSYSHDVSSTSSEVSRLSELTDAMKLHSNEDIEILTQPVDQTVDKNERVVFTCEARVSRCKEEPNLLWFKNREPLIGEIDTTYVIEETTERDAGTYHCLVTHPLDNAKQKESYAARLTVKTSGPPQPPLAKLPKIVSQPKGRLSAVVGEPLEVFIKASGDEPLTFKWYRNSIPLPFAQSSLLRFPVASVTDSGDYCCRVANAHGSILSNVFTLDVTRARVVATDLSDSYLQRVSITIAQQLGRPQKLAQALGVKMTLSGTLEEQVFHLLRVWRDSRRGTREKLHSILKQLYVTLGDSERSQALGQPNTVELTFIQQPQSAKVIYGQPVSLEVAVSKQSTSTRYQWFFNGRQMMGQTTPHLSISSVVDSDVGEYVCLVTDKGLQIYSEPAIIELVDTQSYRNWRAPNFAPQVYNPPKPAPQTTQMYNPPNLTGRGSSSCSKEPSISFGSSSQLPSTVQDLPHGISITEHPASVEIEVGDPLTLCCKATCSQGELSYSWYFNGLLIKDEEQSEYVLNFFTEEDEGFYSCQVSNHLGSVKSNIAQVRAKQDSD